MSKLRHFLYSSGHHLNSLISSSCSPNVPGEIFNSLPGFSSVNPEAVKDGSDFYPLPAMPTLNQHPSSGMLPGRFGHYYQLLGSIFPDKGTRLG